MVVLDVNFFHKGDAVRHRPSVALAGNCAKLIVNGESLFVGGNDSCEEFAGELLPEVVEEVFERAADAAVVVWCTEHDDIRRDDSFLQQKVVVLLPDRVGVEERQGVFNEIECIDFASICRQVVCEVINNNPGDGGIMEATNDQKHITRSVRHTAKCCVGIYSSRSLSGRLA